MKRTEFHLALLLLCLTAQPLLPQTDGGHTPAAGRQDGAGYFFHTVEQGQTVYSIALMYDVSEEDIYRLNPASRQYVKIGEKLKIPQKEVTAQADGETEEMYVFHTIRAGETLYGVSRQYKVPAADISEANPGLTTLTFAAGKTIRIPVARMQPVPETVTKTVTRKVEYRVKKKETLYGICRKFNITGDRLIEYNPHLAAGLKADMLIVIPVEAEETVVETDGEGTFDLHAATLARSEIRKTNTARIALLLPFQVNDSQNAARFVEYYEGFLMAVDSMRSTGLAVELTVHDIGDSNQKLTSALGSEDLLKSNLIIGGVTAGQIEKIAEYALGNGIKYVVPSSSKCDKLTSGNASMFQVNTPYQYLYSYATARVCALFPGHNIIIVDTHDSKDEKSLFIHTLKAEMEEKKMTFSELPFNSSTFEADLTGRMNTGKPTLIIPVSASVEALRKIKGTLRTLAETKPEYRLTLFGHPEWQMYTSECLEDFFALNTHIYTSFYANNLSKDVQRFTARYKYWYRKNMAATYPKFAMLGFDTGAFFISAINRYGSNFEENIQKQKYASLQTGFRFERVNNWGGFINTSLYIVKFNRDYTITRTE
jgi:LysM repeat protein